MTIESQSHPSRRLTDSSALSQTENNARCQEPELPLDSRLIGQIIQNAMDAFILMDEAGQVIHWNNQAKQIFGWRREEAGGRQLADMVIPKRFHQKHFQGLETLRETGDSKVLNRRIRVTGKRKTGEEFPAEITIQALSFGGRRIFSAFVRDVGERVALETRLREAEQRFRGLVEDTPVGIYIHRKLRPLFVNRSYCRMLGYDSPAEFMERVRSLDDTFAVYERERMRGIMNQRMQGQDAPYEYEYDSLCKDGSVKTLQNHARLVYWNGEPAVQGAVVDVTEAGRSSAALSLVHRIAGSVVLTGEPTVAIESVIREICQATGWVMGEAWLPDPAGSELRPGPSWHAGDPVLERFVLDSRRFRFGIGEGLVGRVWKSQIPEWLTDLSAAEDQVFLRRKTAAGAGLKAVCALPVLDRRRVVMVVTFLTHERRAVDLHWLEALYSSLAPLGNHVQRMLAEEQLKAYEEIVAGTPDLLSLVDRNYRFRAVSASYAREFGWRRDDFTGCHIAELFGRVIFESVQKPRLDRCFNGEEIQYQRWFQYPGSRHRWLDVRYTPYRDEGGQVQGALVAARDLTSLRRAQDQSQASRQLLRDLASRLEDIREQERTEIAREVHDDMGQKLTALRIGLSELERGGDGNAQHQEKYKDLLNILDGLLSDVRDLAARLRPAVLDELGLKDAVMWLAQDFANRLNWKLGLDIHLDGVHDDARANTTVFRVLQESLTNVARHAEAHSVFVTIYKRRGRLFMEIQDDGRGIRMERNKKPDSLGIVGMRERAKAAGGRLLVLRDPGGGTRVRLWLPIARTGVTSS